MYYYNYNFIYCSMNARQLKKRKKNCYYLGVLKAYVSKLGELEHAEVVTIVPHLAVLGHNQHNFSRFATLGKRVIKKYSI